MQRVIERAQVRIHFLGKVAGQEAELLSGFDRGPAQHHPRDLVLHQRRQRHRHRQVGLAGAGGADTENDIVIANRVDVELLVDALGRDDALVGRDVNRVEENIFQLGVAVAANNSNRVLDVARIDRVAVLQQIVNLADHFARERLLSVRARNSERSAGDADANAERGLDRADVCVMLPEQVGKQTRIVEMEFERIFSR